MNEAMAQRQSHAQGMGRYSQFENGENCLTRLEARLSSRGEARKLGCGMDSQFTPWVLDWGFVLMHRLSVIFPSFSFLQFETCNSVSCRNWGHMHLRRG